MVCTGLFAPQGREKSNISHLDKLSFRLREVPEALKRLLAGEKKRVTPAAHRNSNCPSICRVLVHETGLIGDVGRHRSQKLAQFHFVFKSYFHSAKAIMHSDNAAQ